MAKVVEVVEVLRLTTIDGGEEDENLETFLHLMQEVYLEICYDRSGYGRITVDIVESAAQNVDVMYKMKLRPVRPKRTPA
ncbi:MAG: hypothetical protein H0W99_16970 [Acidobacteria bacterium]|nr:hypothetical protein [Acidobacteriota bacterium]